MCVGGRGGGGKGGRCRRKADVLQENPCTCLLGTWLSLKLGGGAEGGGVSAKPMFFKRAHAPVSLVLDFQSMDYEYEILSHHDLAFL